VERADAYAKTMMIVVQEIRDAHVATLRGVAQCLNARGFKTPNGKAFRPQSVKNLVDRADALSTELVAEAAKSKSNVTPVKRSSRK
jgi:hypothetical protein